MSPTRTQANGSHHLRTVALFVLLAPPLAGTLLLAWDIVANIGAEGLRYLLLVPGCSYLLAGPAAAITGLVAAWSLPRLHGHSALALVSLVGGGLAVVTRACLPLDDSLSREDLLAVDAGSVIDLVAHATIDRVAVVGLLSSLICAVVARYTQKRTRTLHATAPQR